MLCCCQEDYLKVGEKRCKLWMWKLSLTPTAEFHYPAVPWKDVRNAIIPHYSRMFDVRWKGNDTWMKSPSKSYILMLPRVESSRKRTCLRAVCVVTYGCHSIPYLKQSTSKYSEMHNFKTSQALLGESL
jgi:hypothetical protein